MFLSVIGLIPLHMDEGLKADSPSQVRVLRASELLGSDKTRCSSLLALPAQALRYRIAVHVITQKVDLIREVVAVGRYGGGEHLELLMAIADREEDVGRIMMVGWMGELELKNPHLEEGFGVISQVMNTSGTGHFLRQLWILRARPDELEKLLLVVHSQHRPFMRQMIKQVRSVQLDNLTLVTQLQSSLAPELARWTDSVDFSPKRPHLYPGLELSSFGGLESIGEKRHALSNDMAYPVLYQWTVDPAATRYEFPEDVAVGLADSLGTLGLMAKLFHLEGEVLSLESLVDPHSPHAASLRGAGWNRVSTNEGFGVCSRAGHLGRTWLKP